MSEHKVAILMGSSSDWPVMRKAVDLLSEFGVNSKAKVISAHRNPDGMYEFANKAASKGYKVIIAGAGGSAHLPGMLASMTTLPVIGVPVKLKSLDGMDSLLSIVQMPKGVPVATVGIDRSENAALLAIRILAVTDSELTEKLKVYSDAKKHMSIESQKDLK